MSDFTREQFRPTMGVVVDLVEHVAMVGIPGLATETMIWTRVRQPT